MDERDRRAPVALAGDAPVAQAPCRLLLAEALRGEVGGDRLDGASAVEAVVGAGRDAAALGLVAVPVVPHRGGIRLPVHVDHLPDLEAVAPREVEVALVVRRHAHHGALAVAHQHVVADPHRHFRAGERMRHGESRGHALLLHRGEVRLHHAALLALLDEGSERRIAGGGMRGERMLGSHGAEGDAHQRVGARGEHLQLAGLAVERVGERDVHALAAADPVGLHQPHALRPAGQTVERVEQLGRELRDPHVVHRDLALLDHGARAPAAAVDHLFVREDRLVHGVPVHRAGLAIHDALLEHPQEQPLVPAVVVGAAGGEFALPVDREPERLQLLLHVRDVVVRPLRGRHAVRHRGVLGRQPEGVPAHGLEHVEAAHAVEAREHVADRVVAHVAHVQLARRIREHRQAVVLGPAGVLDGAVGVGRGPGLLGATFHVGGAVLGVHARRAG
jgi:hypothetical protein